MRNSLPGRHKQRKRLSYTILGLSISILSAEGAQAKGFFFDLTANYMLSKLERASTTSSSFSLISTAGQVVGIKTGMELGKSFTTYISAESFTQSFVGPSSRTLQNAQAAPTRMNLGFSYIYKDVELFMLVGQREFLALQDLDATTHNLQKSPMNTASLGMSLSAQSKTAFSLEAEASLTAGLSPIEFASDTITLNSGLAGTLRIMFGKSVNYGVLANMHINEYRTSIATYTHTDFYAGLFSTFNF